MKVHHMQSVFFQPWKGIDYGTLKSIFPKRVLILGDSHYCDTCKTCGDKKIHPECTDFTSKVISDYLNPNHKATWKKTFSTFINSFWNRNTSLIERTKFYDSVAFYNYLQVAAGSNAYSAMRYDYNDNVHKVAFDEVLSELSPEVIIVWGDRVWNIINSDTSRHWLHVHHPCTGYGRDKHYKLFSEHDLDIK